MIYMNTGGFVDDGSVQVDPTDKFAEGQKIYFDKKTKLLYKIKLACTFPLTKDPPKEVRELTAKEKRSLKLQGPPPANFDDPTSINPKQLAKIVESSENPGATKTKITSNLEKIFVDFYNYLCYSDLDRCIKSTFSNVTNYQIVDGDKNIIKVPADPNAEFKSFILDNKGNIQEFRGAPVPEMDLEVPIKEYNLDLYPLNEFENQRLIRLNGLIKIFNLVPIFSETIYETLDYHYKYPFPFSVDKLRYGPTSWNFYQHLFIKDRGTWFVNKNKSNPILLLIQSGQFGIFLDIFNNSFSIEDYLIHVSQKSLSNKKEIRQEYKYFHHNYILIFDHNAYYAIYDKLITSIGKNIKGSKISVYQKIIKDYYKGEINFSSARWGPSNEAYNIDSSYQNMIVHVFTYLYDQVDKKLINDDLVYLHNSAYFINFFENYIKVHKDADNKFNYFKNRFNKFMQNIEMSPEDVREFLVIQYTWILISMYTTDVNFGDVKFHTMSFLKKRINTHLILYLQRIVSEISTFRKIPKTKLLQNMFGKNFETMVSLDALDKFLLIQYCNIQYYQPKSFNFSNCVETTILNILRYVLRNDRDQNRIDGNKLAQLSTKTEFHKNIVNFFGKFTTKFLFGTSVCVKFGKLMQDIPVFRNNSKYYVNNGPHGSYELESNYDSIITLIMYIVDGEVYAPEDAHLKLKMWFEKNGIVVGKTDSEELIIDDLLTLKCDPGHSEIETSSKTESDTYFEDIIGYPYETNGRFSSNSFFILARYVSKSIRKNLHENIYHSISIAYPDFFGADLIINYDTYLKILQNLFSDKNNIIPSLIKSVIYDTFDRIDSRYFSTILPKRYHAKAVSIIDENNRMYDHIHFYSFLFFLGTTEDIVNMMDKIMELDLNFHPMTRRIIDKIDPDIDSQFYIQRLIFIIVYYRCSNILYLGEEYRFEYHVDDIVNYPFFVNDKIVRNMKYMPSENEKFYLLIIYFNGVGLGAYPECRDALRAYANFNSDKDDFSLLKQDLEEILEYVLDDFHDLQPKIALFFKGYMMDNDNIKLLQDLINLSIVLYEGPRRSIGLHSKKFYDMIQDTPYLYEFNDIEPYLLS